MPSTVHDGMDIGRGPVGSNNAVAASAPATHRDEEDDNKAALFGDIPEAKRRKFILVDDTQRNARVRVRVQLDQINMSEVPDSYRRDNSVFPRSYFPMQMQSPPPSATGSGYFNDDEDERDGQPIKGKTMVKVTTLEGEDEVAVPRMSKRQRKKEVLLNDMGYRMSWSQSRVFAYRTIFLQKSLDAYRNKMRSSILANGQEVTNIASHFETRVGKRRWQERTRRSEHARTP
ncbi:MAG: hypothetical protein M1834_004323 [Cirrosporium novae-zelandiae]|nr:MAG: hypothetical protein M1834_004323 [Cirrosporium novae-zelandiae]